MILSLLLLTWVALLMYFWQKLKQVNRFWSDRGVPHLEPLYPVIGNGWEMFYQKNQTKMIQRVYDQCPNDPLVGIYQFTKPLLVIKDISLIEHVLIKDFHHFTDRGNVVDEKRRPYEVNLFSMTGKKWRACRNKFSPMFTTSKIRRMFPQMKELSRVLLEVVADKPEGIDLKETFMQYALDVVASTAFGIDTHTLCEKTESEFRKMIRRTQKVTARKVFIYLLYLIAPKLAATLRLSLYDSRASSYLADVVRQALSTRKNHQVRRDDFLQLMVTLQERGSLEIELEDACDTYLNIQPEEKKVEHFELTDDLMIGQAFLFLLVGLEGTSSALMYLCYELAMNPEIQEKVRAEVVEAIGHSGKLDYESVNRMHYLDQCFKESLRLHSPVALLFRICSKEYTFPGTEVTIPAGTKVLIPVSGLHSDTELYPDPERFDPERFAPDVFHPPCSFLPFGDGPRICLAMKFAVTEMKCVLAKLLMRYRLAMNPSTQVPIPPFESVHLAPPRILFDLHPYEGAKC